MNRRILQVLMEVADEHSCTEYNLFSTLSRVLNCDISLYFYFSLCRSRANGSYGKYMFLHAYKIADMIMFLPRIMEFMVGLGAKFHIFTKHIVTPANYNFK